MNIEKPNEHRAHTWKERKKGKKNFSFMEQKNLKGTHIVSTLNHYNFKRNVNIKTLNTQHEKKSQTLQQTIRVTK